jgi:hypothetical protein
MASSEEKRREEVQAQLRRLRAEFDNYAKSVTLIASVEGWVQHNWGAAGKIAPSLVQFDRFPSCGGLTPDFLVSFQTGYRLCGEVVRTFRNGAGTGSDLHQVLSYTQHLRQTSPHANCGDVVLLVHPFTDEVAAKAILGAMNGESEDGKPEAPVVILSYVETRGANGEWYDLHWRDQPGNSRFSEPNATAPDAGPGLNDLLVDVQHCPIRLDESALSIFAGNPLINDDPPRLYTVVVVIYPAINQLLTEEERDELAMGGRVRKRVSRASILGTPCVSAANPPAGYIDAALDFMAEHGRARRLTGTGPQEYEIEWDLKTMQGKDLVDVLGERAARAYVRKLFDQRARRARRAAKKQLKLF